MGTTAISVEDYIKGLKPESKSATAPAAKGASTPISVEDYIKGLSPAPAQSTSRPPAPSPYNAIADSVRQMPSPAPTQATAAPPAQTGAYARPFIPGGTIGPAREPSHLVERPTTPLDIWKAAMGGVNKAYENWALPLPARGVEPWRDPVAEAAARQERAGFQPGSQIGPGGPRRREDISTASQRMKGKGFVEDGTIGPRKLSQSEAAAAERVKSSGFTPGTEIGPRQIVPPNRAVTREAIKRGIESEHGPILQSPVGKITDPIMQGAAGRIFGGNPEAYLAEGQKTPSMLRFEALVPASAPPEVKAAAEFASGLTSPDNALILVATSGVGTIEKGLGKALLGRLISGGFSADMLYGAYLQLREANEAAKSGDTEKARGLLTQGVLGGVMGALALKHFVKGDPHAENLAEGESTVDLKGTRHDMAEALVQGRKLVKQWKAAAPKATEPPSAQAPAAASISAEDYVKGMKPGEAPAPTVKESSQVPSATPEGKEVNPSVTEQPRIQRGEEVIQPSQEGAAAKDEPSEAPAPAPAAGGTTPPPGAPLVPQGILEKLEAAGRESDQWLRDKGILGGESLSADRMIDPEVVYHMTRAIVGDVARGAITIEEAAKKVLRSLKKTFDVGALTVQDVQQQIQDHIDHESALSELTAKMGTEPLSPAPSPVTKNYQETKAAWSRFGKGVAQAWETTQSASKRLWDAYWHEAPWTNFDDTVGRYDGQLQFGSNEVREFVNAIHKAIPNKLRREGIVNYAQAGGDMSVLRQRADASTTYRSGYEAAMNLNPAEQALAKQIRTYFDQKLDNAQAVGMLKDGVENYVNQMWERNPAQAQNLYAAAAFHELQPNPAFLHKKFFDTYFAGEQAGFTPKDKDIGTLIAVYDQSFNAAIASRAFIKNLHDGVASDGRPIVEISGRGNQVVDKSSDVRYFVKPKSHPKGSDDYVVVDHPALRGWKWATSDMAGNPVFLQGDMLVHPEYAQRLKNILGYSAIRRNPYGKAALGLSSGFKQTLLSLSPFHQVQIGVHALEHRVNPFRIPKLDLADTTQRALVNHGLVVADFKGLADISEGNFGSGPLALVPGINKLWSDYGEKLFRDYIPRIKMSMAMHALERNRSRYRGKLTEDQIFALTARQANAAFGGLNYKLMARNKTFQDSFRLFALAPDFLEARARFVGQSLRPYGREQWQALAFGAVSMAAGKFILGQVLDEPQEWDLKHLFYLRIGGREYGLRTIQGDIAHLLSDPNSFVSNRLNPFSAKPVFELGIGRDQFGRRRGYMQQLEDYFAAAMPIPFKGALPSNPQDFLSTVFQSTGIQSRKYTSAAQQVIRDYYNQNPMMEPSEKSKVTRQIVDAARAGDLEKAQQVGMEAIQKGEIRQKDMDSAIAKGQLPPMAASIKYVPWQVAVKAFKAATDEEQQQMGQVLADKLDRAHRNNPNEFTPAVIEELDELGFHFKE